MAPGPNDYTTQAAVLRTLGITGASASQKTLVDEAIVEGSQWVDTFTGQWWNQRTQTILTEAVTPRQKKLFMPAHIISITSVKEGVSGGLAGVALDAGDFHIYNDYLEIDGATPWSMDQLDIEVVGSFGYTATPTDIVRAASDVAAQFTGLRKRAFTQDDGIEQTILITDLPAHSQDVLKARVKYSFLNQPFKIS